MSTTDPAIASPYILRVVMYHYVRDLERSSFPRLHSELLSNFTEQVREFRSRYEMASVESALAFLKGEYTPRRDLCLLTFDDGLKEHYSDVTPILSEARIQGAFFLITGCIEYDRVAAVHMNHFLMASLDFEFYKRRLIEHVKDLDSAAPDPNAVAVANATRAYVWDTPDVACFKFWFNFVLEPSVRDKAVRELFQGHVGKEREFSKTLYLNWDHAREMCNAGMALGGHSHQHKPLSSMPDDELAWDLSVCRHLLDERLGRQALLPFCYPYGKRDSYDARAVRTLQELAFNCGFSTETGDNLPGAGLYSVVRLDCKKAVARGGVQ